jgi:hypothetical protein
VKTAIATVLPSRLLDIKRRDDASILLIETRNWDVSHYATLSHCWGKTKFIQTTRNTLLQRRQHISWGSLPKTFQDAITIARAIDVQFIWIDSLCIIQDDKEDWKRESARMADIYTNSYINFAATASFDSQGGCFSLRSLVLVSRSYLIKSFLINPEDAEDEQIYVRASLDSVHHRYSTHRNHKLDLPDSEIVPLLSRAWVFQERHLALRTLHFHPSEMVMECKSSLRCECTGLDKLPARSRQKQMNFQSMSDLEVFDAWIEAVEEFSGLRLTYESDRLPALIGVATVFQDRLKTAYLAGIWETDLARGLLWDVVRGYSTLTEVKPSRHRRSDVPSWTWASMALNEGTGITFPACHDDTFKADVKFSYLGTDMPVSAIESNFTKYDDALYVQGVYRTAIAWPRQVNFIQKDLILVFDDDIEDIVLITTSKTNVDVTWDTTNLCPVEAGATVFCMLVGAMIEDVDEMDQRIPYHCALVLRLSTSVHGAYKRIGILEVNEDQGIFENASEQQFKLL